MVSRPSRVTPVVPAEPTKIKVCLVGDTEIGKTCFCRGFKDDFVTQYEPTIGSDFFMKQIKIAKGYYQFNVWDLSGDQNYIEVRNEFFKESQALILMFDITRKASFDALDMWLREASKNGGENLPVFVVGNKSDLAGNRKVQKADAEKWVKARTFAGYFETSPKEGNGYLALWNAIAETVQ